MNARAFGPIRQIAYLVEALDASLERWSRYSGVGPWTVYKNVVLIGHFRGRQTSVTIDVGLSYQDDLQIEIIRVSSRTPSPYQDSAGRTLLGMHHIAWMTDDLDRDIVKAGSRGMVLAFSAANPASRVAYFESADEPGILFEFIEVTPPILQGFAQGVAASRAWDGRDHILQTIDFTAP
jgi:catechol 2,3-dioxygenase-like lactoylglutathione lyase family enzyme